MHTMNACNFRPAQKPSAAPELVGVPIVAGGDTRLLLNFHFKKNLAINKQQGYCDCCGMKFHNMNEVRTNVGQSLVWSDLVLPENLGPVNVPVSHTC